MHVLRTEWLLIFPLIGDLHIFGCAGQESPDLVFYPLVCPGTKLYLLDDGGGLLPRKKDSLGSFLLQDAWRRTVCSSVPDTFHRQLRRLSGERLCCVRVHRRGGFSSASPLPIPSILHLFWDLSSVSSPRPSTQAPGERPDFPACIGLCTRSQGICEAIWRWVDLESQFSIFCARPDHTEVEVTSLEYFIASFSITDTKSQWNIYLCTAGDHECCHAGGVGKWVNALQ